MHRVPIQGDGRRLANFFDLRPRQTMRSDIPKNEVVVRAVARKLVAFLFQDLSQRLGIANDVFRVIDELRSVHVQELRRQGADLMVVRSALKAGENCHVDALLNVWIPFRIFEENHSRPGATQRFVRRGRDDVAMLERRRVLLGCH